MVLPDNNKLLEDGIKYIRVRGMDEDILFANYFRHDEGFFFDRVRFNRFRAYLREFTDMAPKISQERKDDMLFITIDWSDLPIVLPESSRINPSTRIYIRLIKDEQEIAGLDQILDYDTDIIR